MHIGYGSPCPGAPASLSRDGRETGYGQGKGAPGLSACVSEADSPSQPGFRPWKPKPSALLRGLSGGTIQGLQGRKLVRGGAVPEDFIGCLSHVPREKSEESEMEEVEVGKSKKMYVVEGVESLATASIQQSPRPAPQ